MNIPVTPTLGFETLGDLHLSAPPHVEASGARDAASSLSTLAVIVAGALAGSTVIPSVFRSRLFGALIGSVVAVAVAQLGGRHGPRRTKYSSRSFFPSVRLFDAG